MKIELSNVQKLLDWIKTLLFLDANSLYAKSRIVKRGQVYRCNFGTGVGSEIQKDRPAIIIQNDPSNKNSGNTIVVPITHDSSTLSCMVSITPQHDTAGTILLDGQANTSNLMCVSKARLGNYICDLPPSDIKAVDIALAKTIGLMKYYADLQTKYNDKIHFIDVLKEQRNKAQDELTTIREILGIPAKTDIIPVIQNLISRSNVE